MRTLLLCLLSLLLGCQKSSIQEAQKPHILVSLPPYQGFVQRVVGDFCEVYSIVPVGADPHTYEPTMHQMERMRHAPLWFSMGEAFERKLSPLLSSTLQVDLSEVVEMIPLPGCCGQDKDRHVWLSPKKAGEQVSAIVEMLCISFPEHKEAFVENGHKLQEDLLALDSEIRALAGEQKKRVLLVSHPAFAYFCQEYGIEQLSVEQEGKEVRPHHITKILQEALQKQVQVAITLPQHNNKGTQSLAEKLHLPVRMVDPYSPEYFSTLRNLANIVYHDTSSP